MNKIIKRAFSIFLATVLCFGSSCFVSAIQQDDIPDEMQKSMEVLRRFGFIADYYEYNTLMTEKVSRADFVNTVAKLINATEYYIEDELYYYDVPKNHYAYKSISALTKMGVINGTSGNRFEPEAPIEVGAAYKILLTLMGYDRRAESDGGYPYGYIKTAKSLNIYDGASINDFMTRGSMFSTIYKAMKTNIFEMTSISNKGEATYKISENDTLLSVYHNIYYSKGIVKAADMSAIDGSRLENAEEVKIDNEIYDSEVALADKLGQKVEFFYHYDKENEKKKILWANTTGETEVLEIEEDTLVKFDRNSFTLSYHNDNGKLEKITLNRSITVVYNGREVADNVHEIFEIPYCRVKLIAENGDYTTAIIEKADTYVVGSVNTNDFIVYDKANPTSKLYLDENMFDYISIKDSSGMSLSVEQLVEGMVMSVYASQDNRYMKIIVSSMKVTGVVEQLETAERGYNLVVDGNTYLMPVTSAASLPKVGDNVTLYIDYMGDIAYIENVAGDSIAVYVYRAGLSSRSLDSRAIFKAFRQDGQIVELECAKKVECDGITKTEPEDIIAVFNESWGNTESKFKPQLALVRLDNDGKVYKIDTAYVNAEKETVNDSLSLNLPASSLTFKWTGFFEGKAIIGPNTIVFSVPPDSLAETASDKDFSIKKKSDFVDGDIYTIETYKTKERVGYEQFIILKSSAGGSWDNYALSFLVKDVRKVLDEEGEIVDALVGYNGPQEVTILSDGELSFDSIKPGMILRLRQNFHKRIEEIKILFDPDNDLDADGNIKISAQTNSQFGEPFGLVKGYVNDVVDGVIKIARSNPAVVDQMADKQGAPVLIYESKNKRNPIRLGSFNDARTYYRDRDERSIIVMQSYYGTPRLFVIYN